MLLMSLDSSCAATAHAIRCSLPSFPACRLLIYACAQPKNAQECGLTPALAEALIDGTDEQAVYQVGVKPALICKSAPSSRTFHSQLGNCDSQSQHSQTRMSRVWTRWG